MARLKVITVLGAFTLIALIVIYISVFAPHKNSSRQDTSPASMSATPTSGASFANNQMMKPSSGDTLVVPSDYTGVVKDVLENSTELSQEHKDQLKDILIRVVSERFQNKDVDNDSKVKFVRFKNQFPRIAALQKIGVDPQPSVLEDEKFEYLRRDLELRLINFFSIRRLPPDEESRIRNLLVRVGKVYEEEISARFPDYESVGGKGRIANIVKEGLAPIEQCLEDDFSGERWLLSPESLEKQAKHELPNPRGSVDDAGQLWLTKLRDPKVDPDSKAAFIKQYTLVVEGEMHRRLENWTRVLYESMGSRARERLRIGFVGIDWESPEMLRLADERNKALTSLGVSRRSQKQPLQ